MRIAIVDDQQLNARSLLRAVQTLGHQGRAFTDPHEAVAAIVEEPPDLVVVDYAMPKLTGAQVRQAVRARLGDVAPPFVLLSGAVREIDPYELMQFTACLEKPCSFELLREALELTVASELARDACRLCASKQELVDIEVQTGQTISICETCLPTAVGSVRLVCAHGLIVQLVGHRELCLHCGASRARDATQWNEATPD